MSAPGWYPDPSSPRGGFRYWDGAAWTDQTTHGPQVSQAGAGTGAPKNRLWLWFALAMAVVAALVIVLVIRPTTPWTTPSDTNSARPTGTQWNELEPTETPTPPEDPENGETVDCPQNSTEQNSNIDGDGRIHGGGLSFEAIRDRGWDNGSVYIPWLYDHNSQTRTITSGWMTNVSVGYAKKSEGFKAPKSTAEQMMSCLASSDLYRGFEGRQDFRNEAFAIQGHNGWRITANVFVGNQGDIKGDVVDVVVLDIGRDGELAVYISCATIDHEENLRQVERAFETLRVD